MCAYAKNGTSPELSYDVSSICLILLVQPLLWLLWESAPRDFVFPFPSERAHFPAMAWYSTGKEMGGHTSTFGYPDGTDVQYRGSTPGLGNPTSGPLHTIGWSLTIHLSQTTSNPPKDANLSTRNSTVTSGRAERENKKRGVNAIQHETACNSVYEEVVQSTA
ncbi:uncharacterized protein EI90DRAFT_3043791 [Cantharellus anzutake]|uniref:uncharacterized protein n=1 Tax=Cantharellus anzutake TaxID=1750568 RepID=UPI00190540DA|nr:uncharacterized protein EI90DRAFT_3043791 [Cantharellus anzutake]KAF8336836.1 hypothetical protein EI90DRAFT_3043791 [Cantharellus anzutake]